MYRYNPSDIIYHEPHGNGWDVRAITIDAERTVTLCHFRQESAALLYASNLRSVLATWLEV